MSTLLPRTTAFPWPTLNVKADKLIALTEEMISAGFDYGLGAKIVPLSLQDGGLIGTTEIGAHAKEVDCSGFVRWVIYHATAATGEAFTIPDGSANQHQWFEQQGFKSSTHDSALAKDGVIRIGFLSPEDGGGVGHVALVLDGLTMESHGGKGPDRRVWGSQSWMRLMSVFVVALA